MASPSAGATEVWAEPVEWVLASLPAASARVLEVGAGQGELARSLEARGYDMVAIDPAGGPAPVIRVALANLAGDAESLDAAVAVRSLHHVEPLDVSVARLAELVRPGGALVVDEFDVGAFDERAARWLSEHRGAAEDPATLVSELRAHLHPVAVLRTALGRHFRLDEPARGPYLHRWDLPLGHRAEEERLIASGELPATGARFTGVRVRAAGAGAGLRPPGP